MAVTIDPKDWFNYDFETGVITWSRNRGRKIKAGSIVTGLDKDEYYRAKLNGKSYKAHRLAWYLYYNVWPEQEIDHINRIRTDNRISNLRDASRKINGRNLEKYQGNISKHGNGFQVQQSINGKQTYLGFSLDYEEAKTIFKNHERLQD